MTPLTVDMALMGPQSISHQGSLSLFVQSENKEIPILWSKLSLHHTRLPILYLSENLSVTSKKNNILSQICSGLSQDLNLPIQGFILKNPQKTNSSAQMTHQFWSCLPDHNDSL